ncbi:MAG: endolytic transglycosylase MltG [Mariprofundaceae bacterium]|nr:endolytic transglycosylase MltG [Mariprofundaceae bacterium]
MLKRFLPVFLFLGILLAICLGASFFMIQHVLSEKITPTAQVLIIKSGSSAIKIAQQLEQAGIIRSALLMRFVLKVPKYQASFKQGHYQFKNAATLFEVIARLQKGDVERFFVTIPEGLRTPEILDILARKSQVPLKEWQAAWQSLSQHSEGLLLPETYDYQVPIQPTAFLERMAKAQQKVLASIQMKDKHRLLTIASIIEKETRIETERPLVSAVIYNRLRLGMPMQMDPTVIYGLYQVDGDFSGNLRRVDLKRDTPWNTYVHKGLPPTPICHPGASSLRAAAKPADVDFLYFVADGSGGHAFASNHRQHLKNVRKWVRLQKAK